MKTFTATSSPSNVSLPKSQTPCHFAPTALALADTPPPRTPPSFTGRFIFFILPFVVINLPLMLFVSPSPLLFSFLYLADFL
jgi:hypothetical protein